MYQDPIAVIAALCEEILDQVARDLDVYVTQLCARRSWIRLHEISTSA